MKDATLRGAALKALMIKMNQTYKLMNTELAPQALGGTVADITIKKFMFLTELKLAGEIGDISYVEPKTTKVITN